MNVTQRVILLALFLALLPNLNSYAQSSSSPLQASPLQASLLQVSLLQNSSAPSAEPPVRPSTLTLGHPGWKRIHGEEYAAQIAQLQQLAEACRAAQSACAPPAAKDLSIDVIVESQGSQFEVNRDWLRTAFADSRLQKDQDRAQTMDNVLGRLRADASDLATPAQADTEQVRARAEAILNRTEFRTVKQNAFLEKQLALLSLAIDRLLNGFAEHLPHSPGAVLLIEWGIVALAAASLLLWAWRSATQQRLAITQSTAEREAVWQKESDDWARLAEAEASRGQWREAVHCLYWAAIVMLEGRRLWRANRARTPREYLPLLEQGSERQRALEALTRVFERIWYGLRPADQEDFRRAQTLLDELRTA